MNKAMFGGQFKATIAAIFTLLIIFSCAPSSHQYASRPDVSQSGSDDASVPPAEEPGGKSGEVEEIQEITVMGARAGNEHPDRRRMASLPQSMMSGSTLAGAGIVDVRGLQDYGQLFASLETSEELWVIAKPEATASQHVDDSPGSGAMVARFDDDIDAVTGSPKEIPLPLKHTDVNAVISGYISTVNVTQKFQNPFNEKIEAVYMFPLPEKAAVSEFLMIIGERKIRGILREKEEAEAIYREARAQGYQASLLVQHRPNVFEQKVANIEPGKSIDVDIKYFHTLAYKDGWYSFVFPTVVGPRYNPPEFADPIRAVPSDDTTDATNGSSVRYLRPDERSAHDISINVEINAGVAIEELRSTHRIDASRETPETATVSLASQATIPNRDFVLDFQVAGSLIKSNLLSYVDPESQQGYFTLMMYPPAMTGSLARQPMELVFVIDCSGSMSGRPLKQAKNAVSAALSQLNEDDTFQIIRFSDNASQFGPVPVPATEENLSAARRYLERLNGTGGTQMIEGIKSALDFAHDPARLRFVSFMTDGYIGNEVDIIAAVHDRIGDSRIFSFGVGTSVNRYLLERMAKEGRGAVAYLAPQDSATSIMDSFFERISHPAMTDVEIDWGGMAVTDVYPAKLPDLFVGRSVIVTGKFLGSADDIEVIGHAAGRTLRIPVAASDSSAGNSYVSKIWARLRIADLADRQAWQADPYNELGTEIRMTALEHQLMSDYTSFVAVDTSHQTEGERGTTVHQAVPVPDGVRYETTVRDQR